MNWINEARVKKGALHKQLGIPEDEKIPYHVLEDIKRSKIGQEVRIEHHHVEVTRLLKERAILAENLRQRRG